METALSDMTRSSGESDRLPYNDNMSADQQITTEEKIASLVLEAAYSEEGEEAFSQAGRNILKLVLQEFRPDLIDIDSIGNGDVDLGGLHAEIT